ncbi:CENP-Q, a CENPA-CAD centromere complex subunit-domain-containing protein [Kalaharituber pfeilii]|nr:CENP-Q, a CENPA-CAD centromere complex subunit-domain-containing protein [Kalaharituber pfeilii]
MAPTRKSTAAPVMAKAKGAGPEPRTAIAAAASTGRKDRRKSTASGIGAASAKAVAPASALRKPLSPHPGNNMGKKNTSLSTSKSGVQKGVASGRVTKRVPGSAAPTAGSIGTRRKSGGAATVDRKNARGKEKQSGKGTATNTTGKKRKSAAAKGDDEKGDDMEVDEEDAEMDAGGAEDEEAERAQSNEPNQPILQARTRRIPIQTVEDSWAHIPEAGQKEITEFLDNMEKTVINTFTSDRRKQEAQVEIRKVKKRLILQLPKIPVPPVPVKGVFSLEKLHEQNRQMESIIRPDLEQIGVLEAEIERTRRLLQERRQQLRTLKTNANDEAAIRRKRAGRLHEALRDPPDQELRYSADNINLASAKPTINTTYDPSQDAEIVELKTTLKDHLTSMAGNAAQLEGFSEQLRNTRCVVDEVLWRMGSGVYDTLMGV